MCICHDWVYIHILIFCFYQAEVRGLAPLRVQSRTQYAAAVSAREHALSVANDARKLLASAPVVNLKEGIAKWERDWLLRNDRLRQLHSQLSELATPMTALTTAPQASAIQVWILAFVYVSMLITLLSVNIYSFTITVAEHRWAYVSGENTIAKQRRRWRRGDSHQHPSIWTQNDSFPVCTMIWNWYYIPKTASINICLPLRKSLLFYPKILHLLSQTRSCKFLAFVLLHKYRCAREQHASQIFIFFKLQSFINLPSTAFIYQFHSISIQTCPSKWRIRMHTPTPTLPAKVVVNLVVACTPKTSQRYVKKKLSLILFF